MWTPLGRDDAWVAFGYDGHPLGSEHGGPACPLVLHLYFSWRSARWVRGGGEPVAITVERLDGGEVSPHLSGELRAGDQLELRGPIGRWFVWDTGDDGPLLLIAGGSGTVPLRAILRHRQRSGSNVPVRLRTDPPGRDGRSGTARPRPPVGRIKTERFGAT